MDKENSCMLKEITNFLIKVGEHCLECEGKTVKEPPTINFDSKVELEAGHTYMIPTDITPILEKPKQRYVRSAKKSYLEKWITNGVFEVFTLEQFYKAFPKQRDNKNLNHNILKLLEAKKIAQLGKNRYMVNR